MVGRRTSVTAFHFNLYDTEFTIKDALCVWFRRFTNLIELILIFCHQYQFLLSLEVNTPVGKNKTHCILVKCSDNILQGEKITNESGLPSST